MEKSLISRRQFAFGSASAALAGAHLTVARPGTAAALDGRPAILGGSPVRTGPFPSWPVIDKLDEQEFLESLRQRRWCRLYGDTTTRFEERLAQLLGAKHAIGVVNGTNALYAALYVLDVGPGDEVLVPAYTFVATVNAIVQQYALPVFVDTDPVTQQLDTSKLESLVTEDTRCILPVHLGGNVANMDEIMCVATKHRLSIVEDACQAHFSEWNGRRAGTLGDIGCFSFQSTKILPCGEGGAVVTSHDDLYDRLHAYQNNGRDRVRGTRNGYLHQGSNLRMTEFQAALLLAQLTRFEQQSRNREENAKQLTLLLKQIPGIEPAGMYPACTRNTSYVYLARYDERSFKGLSRTGFLRALRKEGIPCGSSYRPLNREPFMEKVLNSRHYQRIYSGDRLRRYREKIQCPATDTLSDEGLFFSHTLLMGSRQDVEQIAEGIARIQKHAEEIARL